MVVTSLQRLFPYTLIQYDTERDEPLRTANGLCVETPKGEKFCLCSCETNHSFAPVFFKLNLVANTSTQDKILAVRQLSSQRAATYLVTFFKVRPDCWCRRSQTLPLLSATPKMRHKPRGRGFAMFSKKEIFTSTVAT